MNEIGQYITGSAAGALILGGLIYKLTQKWKAAYGKSGNEVKILPSLLSVVFGMIIAFIYPPQGNAANGELDFGQFLMIVFYGLINGMMIALASMGAHSLLKGVKA